MTALSYYDLSIEAKNKAYQQFVDSLTPDEKADPDIDRLYFCRCIGTLFEYDSDGNLV